MANHPGYTDTVRHLMDLLGRLPGVGSRSAERMAFHLLKSSREEALALADAIRNVKDHVKHCSVCFNLTETDPCPICASATRDHTVVCIVEQPKDLLQLEATGVFAGVYHVLLGRLAALENISPADLTIPQFLDRLRAAAQTPLPQGVAPIKELILATNPTFEGDSTALYIQQESLKILPALRITRLARGLPSGAQIEYANKAILADAISGRTSV